MTRLDHSDIDRPDQYLFEHCAPAGGLPKCEALDGFLCAVVAAPELIHPSEWIESAFGHEHAFEDQQAATELIGLLMRFYAEVVARLGDPAAGDKPTAADLMPLVALPEIDLDAPDAGLDLDATDVPVGALWAYGFRLGRELRPDAWERLADSHDELDQALFDIDALMLGVLPDDEATDDDEPPPLGERLNILSAIPLLLHELYIDAQARFWLPAPPIRRVEPKVGRNDPCPCGSGRKHKHCHGRS